MKKDGDPVDGDMVNKETEHAEAEGEGSSVCGRGKAVRRGGVQCKLPLSRISGFMAAPRVMCLFCERSFLSAVLLQKHTNRCHRVLPARRTSARNNDQTNTTTHNYHPGCNFCNSKALAAQKVDDLPALFHHLLDRHSLKYFGCRPCEQRFSDSNQLKSHNKTIHPELLETTSISNVSENNTNDVVKCSSVQLPASETNKEKVSSISFRNSYESIETELFNLQAKVLTKRVSLSTPSKSSTPVVVFSDNKKELRSRKNTSKTRSAKTLSKEISAIPPDTRQQAIKDVEVKNINSTELKKLQDAIVLIPPPPRDGFKSPKKGTTERDGMSESIDKKLSKMVRASVTLTQVQIKPVSNSDTQMLSRLGLAQNRSSRAQSLRRNRKAPSAETRSSSEVSRRDKSKGKNDNEFIINKNRNDPGAKFDPDFYLTVSNNVRENLLKHLDGKLEKSNVACDVPDVIDPKVRSTHAVLGGALPKEIHGSDVALNAITIFPTLLAPDQYGSDKVPHYSYGANTQGFKKTITKNSWKWKWDITKKLKQIPDVGKRDLSRLDIWTQLAMRERYDKDIAKNNSGSEESDGDLDKAERQRQVSELNAILDRRVFPDILSELQMFSRADNEPVDVSEADIKPDKTEIKQEESSLEKRDFMAGLKLTVNSNPSQEKGIAVFSGEWQRPRCYVCCVCGRRADCLRLMEAHQASQHPYAQATYYELVGKEALDDQLYKHLYIPGYKRNLSNVQKKVATKNKQYKSFKLNQSTRILRTTVRNIKSLERPCTKCKKLLLPSELHRHILECAGDYGWMMSKKKCKNKPFGARRRRLKGLYKRERPQDDGERSEKDVAPRPKLPPRPRSKPSDVETIEKMLANLPAKRASKQVLDMSPQKSRKTLIKKQNHILRRILPDTKLKRSKTTVVRTIKDGASGKLRRVTRSITSTEPIVNKVTKSNAAQNEISLNKVKANTKSKKGQEQLEDSIALDTSKKTLEVDVKKRRRNILKRPSTSPQTEKLSTSKDSESDASAPSKNDATSAVVEENNKEDDDDNNDKQRRLLRRRPESTSNPKVLQKRTRKNNYVIDKCADSNSENTQDNSNPLLTENKLECTKPNKFNNVIAKAKSGLMNVKRKSKKVLGLPLKWIGKRGRVSKLKTKKPVVDLTLGNVVVDNISSVDTSPIAESNQEITGVPLDPAQSVTVASTYKEQEDISIEPKLSDQLNINEKQLLHNKIGDDKCVNLPVTTSSNTNNSSTGSNLPITSLSNDPRHSNTGYSNFGSESHNMNSQNQSQYQHLYNSAVQGANVSNLGSKTAPINFNQTLGFYLPSSLQIISHSKGDQNFERSSNTNKADDFAIDNIDKPPLFSSVRAQSQMKEMIPFMNPTLAMQKAYMQTNFDVAHSLSKSKISNKSKRGLNDCIAMLRGKLTSTTDTNKDNDVVSPMSSNIHMREEHLHCDFSLQPLDLSGRCQAEDLSLGRRKEVPENLTVPKPHSVPDDYQEVQDLSMKTLPKTTPSKTSLLNVRKPVFDPTLRIPQYSAPIEQPIPKPSTSSVDQSNYAVHSSSTTTKNTPYASKVVPHTTSVQPTIDLASNISHELSLLPQTLVNTIEKLPPLQQEEIVKVLIPQVLVKAVENYNLLRTESSKRQNEHDILKNISSLTTPIELTHNESPATREEHIRPKPTIIPQTSEISTQTSVSTKEEDVQKCPPEYINVNTDLYLIDPISGMISERKIDKYPNKIVEALNVTPVKPRGPHEIIDLTDEVTVKEPEEEIPAAIIEKPKAPESNVRNVVIIDPISLDKNKTLERSKPKGTASLRAVRIKSTSEKMKIKNMAITNKPETLPASITKSTVLFVPQEVKETITKPPEENKVTDVKEDVVNSQPSTEHTITSSKDKNIENAELSDPNISEPIEPAIQQDEVSSTQHSSVEEGSDASADISVSNNISPLRQKLTDMQIKATAAVSDTKLDESSNTDQIQIQKYQDEVGNTSVDEVLNNTSPIESVSKHEKQKATPRKKRTSKANKEKKIAETSESSKLKENTREKETKEINPVVDKRDKSEPKTNEPESDKKTSFNNLLKECNTLSESALTPSNAIDFHTERKALDKCENIQMSEPIQDDAEADRSISVRRSLRSKKTILKETQASIIEKGTNIFENRSHSNDIEPIPDVPGAIIPEESYKANLGNTTEIIDQVTETLIKEIVANAEESDDDDDDICLAAFSKKNTPQLPKSTVPPVCETINPEPISNSSNDLLVESSNIKEDKKKLPQKTKKKINRAKKTTKDIVKSSQPEPSAVEELQKQTPDNVASTPPTFTVDDVLQSNEVKNNELSAPIKITSLDTSPSVGDTKKETTRKSGRLKTQNESFASIDSVKLSENGHLIFKMHKEPKDTVENVETGDKTDAVPLSPADLNIDTVSPDIVQEDISKTIARHKRPRKSKVDNNKVEESLLAVADLSKLDTVIPDFLPKEIEPNEPQVNAVLEKIETTSKKRSQKRTKEEILPTTEAVVNNVSKDKMDAPVNKIQENFASPQVLKKTEKTNKKLEVTNNKKNKVTKPRPNDVVVPSVESDDFVPEIIETFTDAAEMCFPSSDEDIVLCKLVPKKKLKKLKSRSSPRGIDTTKIPTPAIPVDVPRAVSVSEDVATESSDTTPVVETPELRKSSSRIKNMRKVSTLDTESIEVSQTKIKSSVPNSLQTVSPEDSPKTNEKSKPVVEKRSPRKINSANKEVVEDLPQESLSKNNKKTSKQKFLTKLPDKDIVLESDSKSVIGEPVVSEDVPPNQAHTEDSLSLPSVTSTPEKIQPHRKSKKSPLEKDPVPEIIEKVEPEIVKSLKTKAARKDDTEQTTIKDAPTVERVLSPRRSGKKALLDKETTPGESSDNEPILSQLRSQAKLTETEDKCNSSVPELVLTPGRARKKSSLDQEEFTETKDKIVNKGLKTKSMSKEDEAQIPNVLPEITGTSTPRKGSRKPPTEKESPVEIKEKSKSDLRNKTSLKDDFVEAYQATPEVLSPRRGARKILPDRKSAKKVVDKPNEIKDKVRDVKTRGSSKENVTESSKTSDAPDPVLSPRRTTKRSPPEPETVVQTKDESNSELKTKATLKEDSVEPLKEVSSIPITAITPRKSKKKSILERELFIQPAEVEANNENLQKDFPEMSAVSERVLSPRRSKKSMVEKGTLPEVIDAMKIKTDELSKVSTTTTTMSQEILPPRRSSKKNNQINVAANELMDEFLDQTDDKQLSKSLRRISRRNDPDETQKLSASFVLDDIDVKIVRTKSSRTVPSKESPIAEKQFLSVIEVPEDSCKNLTDDIELSKIKLGDDIKSRIRSLRSKAESSPEKIAIATTKNDSPSKNKKSSPVVDELSESLDAPLSCTAPVIVNKNKKKDLMPIIIDTTPNRKEITPKPDKKSKKSLKTAFNKISSDLHGTKKCLVSLDELDVDKMKQDLIKETSIVNHSAESVVETTPISTIETETETNKVDEPAVEVVTEKTEIPLVIKKSKKSGKKKSIDDIIPEDKTENEAVPSILLNPDIIESSNDINCNISVTQNQKVIKRKSRLDSPSKVSLKKQQIVQVDVHFPKEHTTPDLAPKPSTPSKILSNNSGVNKTKKHKKKIVSKPKSPDYYAIDDDLSSEEPLQSMVEVEKQRLEDNKIKKTTPWEPLSCTIDNLLAKLSEGEASDKSDSSTCLASLVTTQRKKKKKRVKTVEKFSKDTSARKSKRSVDIFPDSKIDSFADDSFSDSDSLMKLRCDKLKIGMKRKRKSSEVSQKVKPTEEETTTNLTSTDASKQTKEDVLPEAAAQSNKDTTDSSSALPVDPESIQDKYLADFGMYTEKRPRKSTLLAMKKISKTFRPDGEDNSDVNNSEDESRIKKITNKKIKKAAETKTIEIKPVETITVETKTVETKTVETKAVETKAVDTKISETKNTEDVDKQSSAQTVSIHSVNEEKIPEPSISETIPNSADSHESQDKVEDKSSVVEDAKRVETPATEDEVEVPKKQPKTSENYCALCKRKFRRQENLLKHQMTLTHISRVSEVEAKEIENKAVQEEKTNIPSIVITETEQLKLSPPRPASRVHKNLAERKSFENKTDMVADIGVSPLEHTENIRLLIAKDTSNPVIEIATESSRKTLSTDEALFFECCSLLKESNDIPLGAAVEPAPDTYPLTNEQNNSSSDSTPYISGVKNILKASELVPPSLTGESDNTMELSQTDSNSDVLHTAPDKRMFAFANKSDSIVRSEDGENRFKHFLINDTLFGTSKKTETTPLSCIESEDVHKKCSGEYDPYSAESLMVRTNSDDFSDNGDSMISSQDADNTTAHNTSSKSQSNTLSEKSLCQPLLINEFEDKFDKIKRKAREKAQAAQEAMAAVIAPVRSHSKKSSKKNGSKSRKMGGEKKNSQSLSKSQKSKNKSKKKNIITTADKGNSKKILTKAALKGFDSVKVSISSEEINFQDVLDTKGSPIEYQVTKDKDMERGDFDTSNDKVNNIEPLVRNSDISKKTLPSFGSKASLKGKQKKHLFDYKRKVESPFANDKHDIYEFMDDEDDNMSDSFKFRTPTAINRVGSSAKKGELPLSNSASCKSSLDVQNDDSQISSLSFSDRDEFNYMSDDYNAHESGDETNHSSNSLEGSTILSKSSKKHKKSSKHRNIKKNAIMGKIFKNNAIRNNDQSPSGNDGTENPDDTAGCHPDMDQLFDSLFEQAVLESSQATEAENKVSADVTDTDDMYSAGDEVRADEKIESNIRSPSPCESDSDNDDDPNPIPAYPRTSQRKIVPRLKARSSDDEALQPKPQPQQLGKKSEIGVASHKSQRKCTTGKQNVLVESWSSESDYEDFRQFEEYSSIPRPQKHHRRPRRSGRHRQVEQSRSEQSEPIESNNMKTIENTMIENNEDPNKPVNFNSSDNLDSMDAKRDFDDPNISNRRVSFTPNNLFKNKSSKRKRRQSQKPFDYDFEFKPTRIAEPPTTQRRIKRAASEMLYYWSSSSDDDMKNTSTDIGGRETEPVEQHGWIVGDSHKKLVTMLAHAKGRKVDDNASVKEKKSRPS